jgi:hypothetical protein
VLSTGVARQLRWILPQDRCHRLGCGVAPECALACGHLVHHAPEREDVGPVVDDATADLLRRHVADGAHHHAGLGLAQHRPPVGCLAVDQRARLDLPRQAEVEDLHAPVGSDEDVLGLQVAMDDALVVSSGEAIGDRSADLQCLSGWQGAAGEPLAQRLAFEQLHHRIRDGGARPRSGDVHAEIVNCQDVGMRERGDRLGLALEPGACRLVGRQVRGKHLDGDVSIELLVTRLENLAHPAGAKRRDDAVRAEASAGFKRHRAGVTGHYAVDVARSSARFDLTLRESVFRNAPN